MRDVSVVLPTFEEHRTVGSVIEAVLDIPRCGDIEIVVVDDSPTPRTRSAVHSRYAEDSRVRYATGRQAGLAQAILDGFELADGECYVVLDADGQHPPRRIRNLLDRLGVGADLAIASRYLDGGDVAPDWSWQRRVVSMGATTLAKLAVPTARKLTDPLSGFFAVDADVVDPVRGELNPAGYKILLELLVRCPIHEIAEVPYSFGARVDGESNLGAREFVDYLRHLGRLSVAARRSNVRVVPCEVVDDVA